MQSITRFRLITLYYVFSLLTISTVVLATPFKEGFVTSTTLHNGLKVIVLEDHSAELTAVEIWVKTGCIDETRSNNGVAHFIEHLMFRGSVQHPAGQADRKIESFGATLDATASRDSIRLSTTVSGKYFKEALATLTDVAMRATLDPMDVQRERMVILDEIARRDNDPIQTVAAAVIRNVFPNHPYGFPIEGSAANVSTMTVEQIREFYQTYFTPNNMAVIVVGDIEAAKAVDAVTEAFREFKKSDLPAAQRAVDPKPTAVRKEKVTRATKLTYCALGFPGPGIEAASDVYAMDVLMQYLVVGYQSWMETGLRIPEGDVPVTAGEFTTRRDPGNVSLMFGVDPASVEDARQAVFAKLKALRETPLPEAEVDRAKRSVESNFAFDTETFSGRTHSLGFYESLGDYKLALSYADNIRKVTPDQIREVAAKYLDTDTCVIVEVGP